MTSSNKAFTIPIITTYAGSVQLRLKTGLNADSELFIVFDGS